MHMKFNRLRHRQQGMTLVVGLILLVILTLVSVLGFRNVTMSERMAGNSADRNVAFQSAESVGKEALTRIESVTTGTAVWPSVGYFDHTIEAPPMSSLMAVQGGGTTYWTQGGTAASASACVSTAPFDWATCSDTVANAYVHNAAAGRYVIELLSAVSASGSTTRTYRVTTRSTGGTGQAEVILQTLYTTVTTP